MSTLLNDLDRPAPIVLAPTGMVPTRSMTPHVPLTPDEIAADVAAAAAVGITSVHLHARDEDGDPTGFVTRPISGAILAFVVLVIASPLIKRAFRRKTPASDTTPETVQREDSLR